MGAFEEEEITGLAPRLQQLIHFDHRTASDHFPTLPCPRRMQIRAILFAPDRAERTRRVVRYIHGQELTGYIWNCFRPNQPRPTCATKYRINTWGHYSPIVRCFKDPTRDSAPDHGRDIPSLRMSGLIYFRRKSHRYVRSGTFAGPQRIFVAL